jgi:hypothetical protein
MAHTCGNPLFHQAMDMADQIARIREVLNEEGKLVSVNREDLGLLVVLAAARDWKNLEIYIGTGAFRALAEATGRQVPTE